MVLGDQQMTIHDIIMVKLTLHAEAQFAASPNAAIPHNMYLMYSQVQVAVNGPSTICINIHLHSSGISSRYKSPVPFAWF